MGTPIKQVWKKEHFLEMISGRGWKVFLACQATDTIHFQFQVTGKQAAEALAYVEEIRFDFSPFDKFATIRPDGEYIAKD